MENERVFLTVAEAEARLPAGTEIHTLRAVGRILLGCDWPREEILALLRRCAIELAGPQMTARGHGLVVTDDKGWLFIATKKEKQGGTL